MRLLQKLGWRPGRGVGSAAPSRQAEEAGSKWGTVSGVSLDNTPLYVLEPKVGPRGGCPLCWPSRILSELW